MTEWAETDFVGGDVVLDFLNTVGDHDKKRSAEKLTCWADAIAWAERAGVLSHEEAERVTTVTSPEQALRHLRDFRDAAHGVLSTALRGVDPPKATKVAVESAVREAVSALILSSTGRQLTWAIAAERDSAELLRHRLALRLFQLIAGPEVSRIKECRRCSWLFLDHGRGSGRVWCKMAGCGNRAKMERFRQVH